MNSLKAIISGVVLIVVAVLTMQLAYLFIAVGYNDLAKAYPYLNEISGIFRYIIAIPLFLLIMLTGGYLTAAIANKGKLIHCLIVGIIFTVATMWAALANAEITTSGIIINLLMIGATMVGGLYWKKRNPA